MFILQRKTNTHNMYEIRKKGWQYLKKQRSTNWIVSQTKVNKCRVTTQHYLEVCMKVIYTGVPYCPRNQ